MTTTLYPVPTIGTQLPNGAIVLDSKRAWDESSWVVLCLWTEDKTTSETFQRKSDPYVTWHVYMNHAGKFVSVSGHYFDQLSKAVTDFEFRI